MQFELCQNERGWDALRGEWNARLEGSVTQVPFLTWEWQRTWWEAFGAGRTLHLVIMRDAAGQLRAIAPLFAQDTALDPGAGLPEIHIERSAPASGGQTFRTLHWIGGTEVSDYLDLIVSPQLHREACATLLEALGARDNWHLLDLHCLRGASPTAATLAKMARARGWDVQQVREDVCPVVELPGTWDEYLSLRLDKKQRHELRRKMRRAAQETHVEWHWVEKAEELDAGLETFFLLHKASQRDKDAFMDPHMQSFFRNVARLALEKDWLRLSILSFNGQPVGSYLCFDYGLDRLVYNSGYDQAAYADLAPGIVLVGYMIEDAIQRGLRRFDLLRGNERYKYDFGPVEEEVLRLVIRRATRA